MYTTCMLLSVKKQLLIIKTCQFLQDHPKPNLRSICVDDELLFKVWVSEDWGAGQESFQLFEGVLCFLRPVYLLQLSLSQQVGKWG